MRHGKKLGFKEPVLHSLVDVMVAEMGTAYPELKTNHDAVVRVVRSEEERFDAVLTAGLPRLEEALDRAAGTGNVMSGDEAFRLYDSLGCRWISWRILRASATSRSIAKLTSARWTASG
jgi:alanyl-tRNA synthetase